MTTENHLKHPFGEECCEAEIKLLQADYSRYYFEETPFNKSALDDDCYLIVGRRGSGKSSLSHYFSFQRDIKNCRCIDIDEPEVFDNVLTKVSTMSAIDAISAIPRVVKIWEYLFWSLIFSKYRDEAPEIELACISQESRGSFFIRSALNHIIERFLPKDSDYLSEQMEGFLSSSILERAKEKMLKVSAKCPVIVAMDSLEKYAIDNQNVMISLAALIQCSSNFNVAYSGQGIHVKTFVSAEVFPHLTETVITNTVKYVRNPVYMHWRPKDLLRLSCWRFFSHLKLNDQLLEGSQRDINWASYDDVYNKMWMPYFGEWITNGAGIPEKTFPYILRHTQMRPRQIVTLCNAIAKQAKNSGTFPVFKDAPQHLIATVKEAEIVLATGVINAYSSVYPRVNKILDALNGIPQVFEGKLLDKIAKRTSSAWPLGDYSPAAFKQILAELGIVGVVRRCDERSRIIEADFEYTIKDRLALMPEDRCVLHPMFFGKFRATPSGKYIIYPFPDHPDFQGIHR
jgi:hypothetical protein